MTSDSSTSLSGYVKTIRRRRRIVAVVMVAVLGVVLVYSLHQEKLYQATSKVLVQRQTVANQLNNTQAGNSGQDFTRILTTQAAIAESPEVAKRVVSGRGEGLSTNGLLAHSSVSAEVDTDLLAFNVTSTRPAVAISLANAYATVFTNYRRDLDTRSLKRARLDLQSRMRDLANGANGRERSALLSNLAAKDEQLGTLEALQTSNAAVVERASDTKVVQPRILRNMVLALIVAVGLAIAAALLADALDSRVRDDSEIDEALEVPLLGRIPWERGAGRPTEPLITLVDPSAPAAEAFRVLRTNLGFVSLGADVKSIAVSSALPSEGKSMTVSNLAVSCARGGASVILLDMDLRKPTIAGLFGLQGHAGLVQVLLGVTKLSDALCDVPLFEEAGAGESGAEMAQRSAGRLQVLTAGGVPPNPGELASSPILTELLRELESMADIVLVDTPPILHLGDAMALSTNVSGLVVVTKLGSIRRSVLHELSRLLQSMPAAVLGYVVTNAPKDELLGYGYGYGYGYGKTASGSDRGQTPGVATATKMPN